MNNSCENVSCKFSTADVQFDAVQNMNGIHMKEFHPLQWHPISTKCQSVFIRNLSYFSEAKLDFFYIQNVTFLRNWMLVLCLFKKKIYRVHISNQIQALIAWYSMLKKLFRMNFNVAWFPLFLLTGSHSLVSSWCPAILKIFCIKNAKRNAQSTIDKGHHYVWYFNVSWQCQGKWTWYSSCYWNEQLSVCIIYAHHTIQLTQLQYKLLLIDNILTFSIRLFSLLSYKHGIKSISIAINIAVN